MSTTTTTTTPINTRILRVNPESIVFKKDQILPHILDKETEDNLNIASEQLKSLNVIGFPTETVYGLGGSALSDKSVQPIYRAKNRPADNPLIVHISSIQQLKSKLLPSNTEIPNIYKPLIDKFWPGPLTILLRNDPQNSPISSFVTGNQDTFAVRMPQHPVARALIAISDLPLAAPSANSSTKPSPTMAKHVYFDLNGKIPLILDGGSSNVGVESTVVDGLSSPPMLLRPGGISLEEIKEVGGKQWENIQIAKNLKDDSNEKAKTPGMKYKHYSPNAKVILFINCGDGLKIMKEYIEKHNLEKSKIAILKTRNFQNLEGIEIIKSLGVVGEEISRNLFKLLREVDEEANIDYIFVEGIDETNEGLAIMNRLNKAAVEVIKL